MLKTIVNEALHMAYERRLDNVAHIIQDVPAERYADIFGRCKTPEEVIAYVERYFFT